ncbi:inorganic phosphate transporter [Pseudomonas citronellolis]|nr:inorganic phosphate transporter [Pseudomonas citronellolis]MCP1606712.1 PiT family inorganic phosphate transporter [Pseudomonas citronellolis]MCP1657419.1 PiT family inorganic phosphate transporter [Pseudomonas citronellolis]MCP1724413.1 PiT family inorganic phosphate transporter [Pseudomonas citronellolis]UUC50532.1 inorganic phosphate transporter [Pseudomonas citronellolis]UXJ52554.1 inorganic phosphate transporter [Pseudomonas citronellolis]
MLDRYHLLQSLRATRVSRMPVNPVLQEVATPTGQVLFFLLLGGGLVYTFGNLALDILAQGGQLRPSGTLLVLALALLIALGFEFINGFHDTANAVATVIYTNALPPQLAVGWSGLWNLLGVLFSSGAVAFGIVTLLPLDLLLRVDSAAGLAMIFALLGASILWNLGTWWLGLPVSSSHTLIGSIVGVSLAHGVLSGTLGIDGSAWEQLQKVGYALLLSPLLGFLGAGLLLLGMRAVARRKTLFSAPQGRQPPPLGIRALLVLTCTGVSFAHGSNDGQKGIGLIMLILAALMPLSFAVDRGQAPAQVQQLRELAHRAELQLRRLAPEDIPMAPLRVLLDYQSEQRLTPEVLPALAAQLHNIGARLRGHDDLSGLPDDEVLALHNELYLSVETIRQLDRTEQVFDVDTWSTLQALRDRSLDTVQFIPPWVKVAVALALGLGTLVGWRRIVTTVGEGIGKQPLTYAQGASAQLTAMLTIGAADIYGLPVSTTQVLSSGVAGTMTANGSGLQWQTIRNMLLAWVLTLPAAICLAALLYWLLRVLI